MISMTLVIGVAIATSTPAYHPQTVGDRPLATPLQFPPSMVDSVHRPGFNGRLNMTRPVIGGLEGPWAIVTGNPGADYYGAWGTEDHVVWARAGHLAIGINPWQRIPDAGLQHLEFARITWLRERGFVGGVRTVVNDATLIEQAESHAGGIHTFRSDRPLPTPRATIHFPDGLPKRPRFQVDASDRIYLPINAPAELRARLEAQVIRTAGSH